VRSGQQAIAAGTMHVARGQGATYSPGNRRHAADPFASLHA
jgi:hypothetical protein